jgi:hypothetical protein
MDLREYERSKFAIAEILRSASAYLPQNRDEWRTRLAGSAIGENTLTTEAFLPEADALILVTSFESPLSDEELRFFKAGTLSGQRVVLHKHDTVSLEQRDAALGFVREQQTKLCHQAAPPIFSVSSTDGLRAKLSHNQALLDTSGIPELEEQLLSFLLAEKNSQLLMRMCDRTREFLHLLPDAPEIERLIAPIDDLAQQFGRQSQCVNQFTRDGKSVS